MASDTTTACALLEHLELGDLTSEEVVGSLLERGRSLERLNLFVHLDAENVLAQARAADARRRGREKLGLLAGVPVAIKDVICVEGEPTSAGALVTRKDCPCVPVIEKEWLGSRRTWLASSGKSSCSAMPPGISTGPWSRSIRTPSRSPRARRTSAGRRLTFLPTCSRGGVRTPEGRRLTDDT